MDLIDWAKSSAQQSKLYTLMNKFRNQTSRINRPIDYIVEGGPFLRGPVGFVAIVSLVTISWMIAGEFTQTRGDRITLFSAGTNVLLTVGLLWIYLSIAQSEKIQAKFIEEETSLQKEIQSLQEDQVDIMGAEFEPIIEILEFGISDETPPIDPVLADDELPSRGDFVHIELSNISNAIATNLHLRFYIDYLGKKGYATGADVPLSIMDNDQTISSKPGAIIQEKQFNVDCHCVAALTMPLASRDNLRMFSTCLSNLSDNGVSRIRIGIVLAFEDIKGKEHEIELEGLELTSSNWPEVTPTLARVRNKADEVPVELVKDRFLEKGMTAIPPGYRQKT